MQRMDPVAARQAAVRRLFRLTGDELVQEILTVHRGNEVGPSEEMRSQLQVEDNMLLGRKWYRIRSRSLQPQGKTERILYLHGGGFILETGTAQFDFVAYLIGRTGAEVWFPEYHIAPEHTCQDAVAMTTRLYEMMLEETSAEKIAVMGDSAGGGLAAGAAIHFRELGLPRANSLILFSPATEFSPPVDSEEQEYLALLETRDPLISFTSFPTIGKLWRGELPEMDYRVTPSAADLTGLPPMLVFAGTGEVLNLAVRHFVQAAEKQGADIIYYEKAMMPHCWVMFPGDNEEERSLVVNMLLDPLNVQKNN